MKILFLGDSITEGVGASSFDTCFVSLVAKDTGYDIINYGVGGTRIARQRINSGYSPAFSYDFNLRFEIMDKEADLVFVFGGTNDFGHGDAPIGEKTSSDVYTFYGALNVLITNLINRYGKEKIRFILPLHRYCEKVDKNLLFPSLKDKRIDYLENYINIMKERLDFYNIKYLDFSKEIQRPLTNENKGLFADGLHPNDAGHRLLADLVIKEIRKIN